MARSDKSRDQKRTAASEEHLPLRGSREASLGGSTRNIDPATGVPPSARPDERADTDRELIHDARAPVREETPPPRGSREASLGTSARKIGSEAPPSARPAHRADTERELTHDARFRGADNE